MIALLLLARKPMLIYCSHYWSLLGNLRQLTLTKQPFLPGYHFHNQALQNVIKKTVE